MQSIVVKRMITYVCFNCKYENRSSDHDPHRIGQAFLPDPEDIYEHFALVEDLVEETSFSFGDAQGDRFSFTITEI